MIRCQRLPDAGAAMAWRQGQAHSDMTLAAMQERLEAEHGVRVSGGAIRNIVQRLGLTFRKSPLGPAARNGRLLDCFSPDECKNYLQAAGYGESF